MKKNMNVIDDNIRKRAELWLSEKFDLETREKVKYLLENDPKELVDAFYKDLEFGTGGLRGIMGVGTNRMNIYTVGMATQGLANYLIKNYGDPSKISVVIAYDSRNNSKLFAETTASVFSANGIKVFIFDDIRPTPELSFTIRYLKCQCGVVITASHNPKEYNGYKVYWEDGGQIINPHDKNIIEEVKKITSIEHVNFNKNDDLISIIGEEIDKIYTDEIKKLSLNPEIIQKYSDLKIVYTPLHGTGIRMVPMSLKKFGFKNIITVEEQCKADGNFPTVKSPNPEEHEALDLALNKAREVDADIVMGTDPDSDRVGVAVKNKNNEWILLNGNQTASILIYYLLSQYKSKNKFSGNEFIVKTIVTTDLLEEIARDFNVECYNVLTGFKYIAAVIKHFEGRKKFVGGGEESYGYLIGDFVRDKDAVISCSMIAEVTAWAKEQNKTLYEILIDIYKKYGLYLEKLISQERKGIEGMEEIKQIMLNFRTNPPTVINGSKVIEIIDYKNPEHIEKVNRKNGEIKIPSSDVIQIFTEDGSKISIRPSGTEPKIKYYFSVKEKLNKNDDINLIMNYLHERIDKIVKDLNIY